MAATNPFEELFGLLDRWRHFPSYQLERRADIFFALYLREVLAAETGVALASTMIPELPLKRDLIWPDKPTSKSVKVDYALFAEDGSQAFFVELKTDAGSRRPEQDEYLERACQLGFRSIVAGIRDIVLATTAHQKYHHLVMALAELGFLSVPDALSAYVYPQPRPGLKKQLEAIDVCERDCPVSCRYLQPVASPGDRCIDFATFAAHVDQHPDPLSKLFAAHLRRWTTPAGASPPLRSQSAG